jgi:uncharacterized membrane protein
MNRYVTAGLATLAGAAFFEALVPGVVIGGAVLLAPKYLPKLRRQVESVLDPIVRRPVAPPAKGPVPERTDDKLPLPVPGGFAIKQAVAKTVTFRVIVTSLDFTTNYLVLGELATAAGLSTIALVAGPLFYLVHETAWNRLGAAETVDLPRLLPPRPDGEAQPAGEGGFVISRALAKTITFRTFATAMDFTTTYLVVGDFVTAVSLTAFGIVLGPFVYFGHEKAWEYFSRPREPQLALPPPTNFAPAIAAA